MKKQFLLFSLLFAFCSIIAVGQDTCLAKFDDGNLSWYAWDAANAPVDIVTNPSLIGNRSDSCAALLASVAWKGIALWNDPSILTSSTVAIAVDVYSNTAGQVKLQCDNSISGGASIELYEPIDASTWTHLVFDISGSALDHKQIAFQNGVADTLYIDNVTLLDAVPETDELLKGGNMEYEAAWHPYWNTYDAKDAGSFEFNYTDDGPTAGDGGCYRVTSAGQAANMLWQPVTIVPGHRYKIAGAYKYLADTAINVWVELFLTRIKPVEVNDTTSSEISTGWGYTLNTWMEANIVNFDGTFEDDFRLNVVKSVVFQIPDTVTQTEWYFAFKAGSWNGLGDTVPVYDVCIDELSLTDMTTTPISVGGNMEDSTAWNPYWNTYDAKDVGTYEFNYTDDGPTAGEGGCYRVTSAGQSANMLWQPVEITPGHSYYLTGAYKYIADTAVGVWVEYFLTRIKPVEVNDTTSSEISTGWGYTLNTWMEPNIVNFDGTFEDDFRLNVVDSVVFEISDTVTQTEWYLAMKAGCWNALGDTAPVFDLLFDEIYMYDFGFVPGNDAMLSKLTVDTGTLDPAFNANIDSYELVVRDGVTSVTVTATPADPDAKVAGAGAINVSSGSGTATIVVTAEDGVTKKTYTVNITVAVNVELHNALNANIYPNPSNGTVFIDLVGGSFSLEVYDITGKTVLRKEFVNSVGAQQFNLSKKGFYILKITQGDEISVSKIIVQ